MCGKSLLIEKALQLSEQVQGMAMGILTKSATRRRRADEGPEIKPIDYTGSARIPPRVTTCFQAYVGLSGNRLPERLQRIIASGPIYTN